MDPLLGRFFSELYEALGGPHGLTSVRGGALPYVLAAHLSLRESAEAVVVSTEAEGQRLQSFFEAVLGERGAPAWLPAPDADPYEGLPRHPGILLERATALTRTLTSPRPAVMTSVEGLLYRVPRPGYWKANLKLLERDEILDRHALRVELWRMGFRQVDLVGEVGEVAFRGGIVDVFPPTETMPVRLELFGEDVESVRYFDPVTQHSMGDVAHPVLLFPLSEALRDEELITRLRGELSQTGAFGEVRLESLNQGGVYPSYEAEIRHDADFYCTFPEFAGSARWTVLEPAALVHQATATLRGFRDSFVRQHRPAFLAPDALFMGVKDLVALTEDPRTILAGGSEEGIVPSERPPVFPGEPFRMLEEIRRRVADGYRCLALLRGQGTLNRLAEMAVAEDCPLNREPPEGDTLPPGLYAVKAPVDEGVVFPNQRWMVVTEQEIFGRARAVPEARIRRREAFSTGLRDLKVNDPVVHVEHGVGLYQGIETLVRDGVREDYLVLAYAGGGKLLVPVARMDLIQKYVGPEGHHPPLDRLGGTAWKKNKDKVKKAVRKVAVDLLKLYATRRTVDGYNYSPDSEGQEAFEAQFPFDLTPDQERTVLDIKADMESSRPMDRIVCGDVGFGKTEVAMRAAFKAVEEGRQVAVLCPTTVLALQHTERFQERFAPFPVKVAMLSRFVPGPEQKKVLKAAAAGEVDIVIGTHRLLSKDVNLPSLGLLIVDEEQRFGVGHKEKIKAMKARVDVLTLTATPIPRTLQMGLSGILDMSLIQTAPKDRLSIQTTVQPYDKELVVSAVRRELSRKGQVYYVHNQVETIAGAARRLQEWVPGARVTIAHGQMGERALEDVMLAFFRGEYDVLVCTTIIENGVDLPRVNTLLVEDAHNFGLTQLYQLRGRIGRSDVPAYAYLLTPPGVALMGNAAKRLETLQEFSELGAGFRVAAVDLELRGAGNLLGGEQSGHMAAVGFELYLRMLEDAVAEAKGETPASVARCEMNLGLDLSIPMEYMEEMNQRLSFYRELSLASSVEEVDRIAAEVADRFGPMPAEAACLVASVRLRIRAEGMYVKNVTAKQGLLRVHFDPGVPLDSAGLVAYLSGRQGVQLSPAGALEVPLDRGEDPLRILDGVLDAASPGQAVAL